MQKGRGETKTIPGNESGNMGGVKPADGSAHFYTVLKEKRKKK